MPNSRKPRNSVCRRTCHLTAPEDRAAYLSLHYWDHFDFADTSLISRPEITEQAFVDFLGILPYTDRAQAAIDTLFRRAATGQEMLYHFIGLSDKYLYEPNSPMHDENCISSYCGHCWTTPACPIRTRYVPATCWK